MSGEEGRGGGEMHSHRFTVARPRRAVLSGSVQAYRQFLGADRLPWLGPAFFTKILYFGGYRRTSGGIQPLILDRRVAARLPPDAGTAHLFAGGWSSSAWRDYLAWAAEQSTHPDFDGEPDAVEMALFSGRWPAQV